MESPLDLSDKKQLEAQLFIVRKAKQVAVSTENHILHSDKGLSENEMSME